MNLQISGNLRYRANNDSGSIDFGTNDVVGTTIAGAYTDKLNDKRMYNIGTSISKIESTLAESRTSDYVEHLRLESNAISTFSEKLSGFAGLNISKFTRGESIVNAKAGIGFQIGLQATLQKDLKADLRYWETNNSGSNTQDNDISIDYDYKISSTTLGISYIF